MITPALQLLHRLWYQPGAIMSNGWWQVVDLVSWCEVYRSSPLTRPALDKLIRQRLAHLGQVPKLSELANNFLQSEQRCRALTIILGLWHLRAAEYLLLRPYRASLASQINDKMLRQLPALLPLNSVKQELTAEALPSIAEQMGATWLIQTNDAAIRASRLLSEPGSQQVEQLAEENVEPILKKLLKWL